MIEPVHADDEPERDGDDADGPRDHAIQLPISRCRGGWMRPRDQSTAVQNVRSTADVVPGTCVQ